MKKIIAASLMAMAVSCGSALADGHIKLKFELGKESRFTWASYDAFAKATDLSGQTLTIFGPWRGDDQLLVESMLTAFIM